MPYCPNCSAYLGEGKYPAVCPKCSYDIQAHQLAQRRKEAKRRGDDVDLDTLYGMAYAELGEEIDTGTKCLHCDAKMLPMNENEFVFNLLGKNVPVEGAEYGQMKITKRVVTEVRVRFDGWVCKNDHAFFVTIEQYIRYLCPVCKEQTVPFGSLIRTCRRCGYNFQTDDFVVIDGRELLEEEGWQYAPELGVYEMNAG